MSESFHPDKPVLPNLPARDSSADAATPEGSSRQTALKIAVVIVILSGAIFGLWYMAYGRPKSDFEQFQGKWTVAVNNRSDLITIRIRDNRWTYFVGGQERRSYQMSLDPQEDPKEIDLILLTEDGEQARFTHGSAKGSEVRLHGIYSIDGDSARVVLTPGIEPRPLSFDTDAYAQVLHLKRSDH